MPHVIRLRGPWHCQALARTVLLPDGTIVNDAGDLPPAGRAAVPDDWSHCLGADFRGQVRYARVFHRPTGLGPDSRVMLLFQQVDAWGHLLLNGQPLGKIPPGAGPTRFDVTDRLLPRNELTVDVDLPRLTADSPPLERPAGRADKAGGLVGEVQLEIE